MAEERGTLEYGEPHPAAFYAKQYIEKLGWLKMEQYEEQFCSCAKNGNRISQICSETMRRLLNSEVVSDRYILGLAWAIHEIEEREADAIRDMEEKT